MAKKGSVKETGKETAKETTSPKGKKSSKEHGFSFRAPEAISVQLVGDFTHWQESPISLRREQGGVWHASVELTPGTHHYRFLVDGEWRDDPECAVRVPNPFGGQDMTLQVR